MKVVALAVGMSIVLAALPAGAGFAGETPAATEAPAAAGPEVHPPARGSYAIVVSKDTLADEAWKAVCDALVAKYDGRVVTWEKDVTEARAALAEAMPNYACFVARPAECGLEFVVAVHRLTRRLDADPYTDCLWAILTGYDADDALRIARRAEPLVLRNVLSGTVGGKVKPFEAGAVFSETKAGAMRVKGNGDQWQDQDGPQDSTKAIVDYFNDEKPDCFITSGHATEHDWQMGYSYKNGQFRCKDGQLFGLDTANQKYPIDSPNPKVYLPVGNCLIGHVSGRDSMVTALIHSAGVVQMFGYIVPTWYGKGGWGIQDIYLDQPGRFTLAEAFFANTQAMLHEMRQRFPDKAGVDFERYDLERRRGLLGELVQRHGLKGGRDELGLLWDRDTVAFYGDPAFDARPVRGSLEWDQRLTVAGDRYTLALSCRSDGRWPKQPVFAFLPHRVDAASVEISTGKDAKPVVTDNFLLVPLEGDFAAGDEIKIVFTARRAGPAMLVNRKEREEHKDKALQ